LSSLDENEFFSILLDPQIADGSGALVENAPRQNVQCTR
jgi:hypothetical protein